MRTAFAIVFLLAASAALAYVAAAQQQTAMTSTSTVATPSAATGNALSASTAPKSNSTSSTRTSAIRVEPSVRIEGEKRFRANCSRCHMAPQKLPPRAAATIIRHMRVRATITDDDMRYILAYLAQ